MPEPAPSKLTTLGLVDVVVLVVVGTFVEGVDALTEEVAMVCPYVYAFIDNKPCLFNEVEQIQLCDFGETALRSL